eukprot:8169812-Prorocentrum_lima.AAC.1
MPRAFTEADTGAAGVKPPGKGLPSREGRGDEVLNAFASPRSNMVVDPPPPTTKLTRTAASSSTAEVPVVTVKSAEISREAMFH